MSELPPSPGRRAQPLRDGLRFLANFVRRPGSIGAVLPSSRVLAEALVGDLECIGAGELVLEYGPGTGPMTEVIRERLPAGSRYLGIELDNGFHQLLSERYPALDFHHGSAGDVVEVLAEKRLPAPMRIISGLPFASLPAAVQEAIVEGTAAALADRGEFRTFQYVHAYGLAGARRFRTAMAEHFAGYRRSEPVLRNVPPAYVLTYTRYGQGDLEVS